MARAHFSGFVPARTRKEFVYADGHNVRLLVRRKLVDADVRPSDMVRMRQRWDKHLSGYILVKEESFTGQLSGARFSYEYLRGGKTMSARIYYLEADKTASSIAFSSRSEKGATEPRQPNRLYSSQLSLEEFPASPEIDARKVTHQAA